MPGGRRPYPWIKLWLDILGDPKMKRLSIGERGCWDGILLLAGQSPVRGKLMLTETQPMTIRDISKALNLTNREQTLLKSCVSKMTELGSLSWNSNGSLEVVNWKKRQEVYPSDAPDKLRINSELTPTEGEGRRKKKDEDVDITPEGARKKRDKPDPRVKEIFDEMKKTLEQISVRSGEAVPASHLSDQSPANDRRIDPIPSYPQEGQAIKRMLARGFTREEILTCWRSKMSQRGGEFISMQWVNKDIKKGGVDGRATKPGRDHGQRRLPTDQEREDSIGKPLR